VEFEHPLVGDHQHRAFQARDERGESTGDVTALAVGAWWLKWPLTLTLSPLRRERGNVSSHEWWGLASMRSQRSASTIDTIASTTGTARGRMQGSWRPAFA